VNKKGCSVRQNACLLCALLTFCFAPAWASAGFINFDDGAENYAVDDAYTASQGVTFSGGAYTTNFGQPGSSGPLGLFSEFHSIRVPSDDPIIITFTDPQSFVSIIGFDIGEAGVRMNAYTSGGTLVGTDDYFGISVGDENSSTILSVTSPLISRIELFQPLPADLGQGFVDGIFFDNLSFTAGSIVTTPEPASLALLALGAIPIIQLSRRRARQTAAT
jgi:hypothetical protein